MRSVRAELFPSTGWFGSVHASEFEADLTRRSALRLHEPREKAAPRILAAAAMPSVGMRRTTRVFGVVKGADGARVLRSGRRLWPDSTEGKLRKHGAGDEWLKMVKNSKGGGGGGRDSGIIGGGFESHGWSHRSEVEPKKSLPVPVLEIEEPKPEVRSSHLFRFVYARKRKNSGADTVVDTDVKRVVYTRRRKLNSGKSIAVVHDDVSNSGSEQSEVVNVVAGARNHFLAQFLLVVLMHMTRAKTRLTDLFAFLASEPLRHANSSSGIDIFLDHPSTRRSSSCKIFGAGLFVPLFTVDFSAVPLCFMNMYLDLFFQPKRQLRLQNSPIQISDDSDDETLVLLVSSNKADVSPSHRGTKLSGQITDILSRGTQKRRSFRRRARNPYLRPNGLASELVSLRKNGGSFSLTASNMVRRSLRSSSVKNLKAVSSRTEGLIRVPTSCSANVLITESEMCCREEAVISLEMSPSGEWFIAVNFKKDGITKFTHKAEKVMKPNFPNRFTHAVTWSGDDEWKLEFPNKQDWMIFKDLYKECFDRNEPIPGVKSIPIPGVNEVSETGEGQNDVFRRPGLYISVKDDELQRAMTRKAPSYDLDSEDELWLEKFNADSSAENETRVLENDFELMIDAFEKAAYCGQYHLSEEKPPTELALQLGSRNAIDSVYSYWMKKRKQKPSSFLLRVFQSLPERRAPVVPMPYFRKKRSVKRPSQVKRPKQYGLFQGFTADREAVEEQRSQQKLEEAKASARRSMDIALGKRRIAQQLMNNADLATYKAVVALRIAEGAASSVAAEHFLD